MSGKIIACPLCGAKLSVSGASAGAILRCAKCNGKFPAPRSDDTIASWMFNDDDDSLSVDKYAPRKAPPQIAAPGAPAAPATPKADTPVEIKPAVGEIHLIKADKEGVVFEFPADRLLERNFRLAMPRRCVRCGIKNNLKAHVVFYMPEMIDSQTLENQLAQSGGTFIIKDPDVQNMPGEELLKRFSKIPNAPQPADLPMPYWVCDMCSSTKMISGQAQINSETGAGTCRLQIYRLRIADEFFALVGGKDTPEHEEIKKLIASIKESPWDMIQEVIQHRVMQWYKPKPDEQFIAYVPDRTRLRTEDGMAGVIITNQRLILHTAARHKEAAVTDEMEMELAMAGSKGNLRIITGGMEMSLAVDREGISSLRRALIAGKYHVTWN